MTDNTTVNSGTGITVATDEIAGVHYQKVKLFDPTADSTTGIGTSGNPLRTDPTGSTTQPVSGTVNPSKVSSATLANVSSSASNVTLFASNSSRIGAMLFNDSTQYLYLKYGATATTSSFTERIAPYAHWYMSGAIYTGIIDGIWAAANGAARTTEL